MVDLLRQVHREDHLSYGQWLHACGKARAEALDGCYWRMLAAGELMSKGWRMAVLEDTSSVAYTVRCLAVAPGGPVPKGCRTVLSMPGPCASGGRAL